MHQVDGPPTSNEPVGTGTRWGLGDVALGLPFIILGAVAGLMIALVAFGLDNELAEESAAVLVLSGLGQQGAQFAWPIVVAKWKGNGVVRDFRLRFKPIDLLIGPALGIAIAIGAAIVGLIVSTALGVAGSEDNTNTAILTDHKDSLWIYGIIFMAVVGAPLSEELFFRGLALSAMEKRWGPRAGLIGSSVLFVLPHYTFVAWRETAVIFAAIGFVALALGAVVQKTNRLGPSIMAHCTFNTVAVLATLYTGV